ncbi:MAG: hypothetical protein JWR67_1350 [Mucilaginibacter sp.]|nr:hypothetical protein [Mucilaginibacter sp.]
MYILNKHKMKTIGKVWILLALTGILFLSACYGSYYVTSRPVEPYYARPVSPYYGAVWIPGEWTWNGRRYVYINGHWARPRAGHVYIGGRWESGPRGYAWHRGYWR